jgi:hypothetical protein
MCDKHAKEGKVLEADVVSGEEKKSLRGEERSEVEVEGRRTPETSGWSECLLWVGIDTTSTRKNAKHEIETVELQ